MLTTSSHTQSNSLSLHDALPFSGGGGRRVPTRGCRRGRQHAGCAGGGHPAAGGGGRMAGAGGGGGAVHRHPDVADRKSTRLNSSHVANSYAVFCLKKKKKERAEQ